MFHGELAPIGGILGPLKSDLGVFWAKIPLYPYNVKTQKTHFLKTLSWADFDLLESNSIYIFVHENKKFTIDNFFSLDACLSPLCSISKKREDVCLEMLTMWYDLLVQQTLQIPLPCKTCKNLFARVAIGCTVCKMGICMPLLSRLPNLTALLILALYSKRH